jgi:hypothetical protein
MPQGKALSGGKGGSKCITEKRRRYIKEKVMIKGISEIRRLPRLGKIRLGEKKTAESGKDAKYHCGDIAGLECPYGSQKHKAA